MIPDIWAFMIPDITLRLWEDFSYWNWPEIYKFQFHSDELFTPPVNEGHQCTSEEKAMSSKLKKKRFKVIIIAM